MAVNFIAPPPKRTQSVQFSTPVLRFITSHCNIDSSEYKDAVNELNSLREATVVRSPDRHEAGLDLISRYYHQIVSMHSRLPISEKELNIKFTWYDAFSKEGILSGGRKAALVSGVYEQCSILFNIGSLQANIARSQNFDSDEGIKNACKHFQGAAGTYQELRELVYSSDLQSPPTPDLSAECTTALQSLMLAQAQEAFCRKAIKDKMKDQITAKIAMQASDLFADAHSNMQGVQVKGLWDKSWLTMVVAKRHYYHGLAQYRMGCVCRDEKTFGQALARMQLAMLELQECDKRGEGSFNSRDIFPVVKRDYDAVKKDNDFIYNDRIPRTAELDAISKAAIAKPTRLPGPGTNFVDVFATLLPVEVSRAMASYGEKKEGLVAMEINKLKEATQMLNGVLASLNLPACIEDTSDDSVPQSLLEKGQAMRDKGGVGIIKDQITELPELLQRNKDIVNEVNRSLDEEEREDTSLRERFKDKWKRTPSAELTKEMRANIAKYQTHLQCAEQADVTVRAKFDEHLPMMELLVLPTAELASRIPKPTKHTAIASGSQVVIDLKSLLAEVETTKAERESIMSNLRDTNDDIVQKFLAALKDEGAIDEASLSDAHLSLLYQSLQQQVAESVAKQEDLVARLQSSHQKFVAECGIDSSGRDGTLQKLAASYDVYVELLDNLSEGTKFYNNLTTLLVKLQSKVNDLIFARNTEKDGNLKDIQSDIAHSSMEQPPARPVPQPRRQVAPTQPPPPQQQSLPPQQQPPPPQQQPPPPQQQSFPPQQQPPPPQQRPMPPMQQAPSAPPPVAWQQPPPGGYYRYPAAPVPYYPQYYPPQPYVMPPPQGYPGYVPPYGAPPPNPYNQPRPPHQ